MNLTYLVDTDWIIDYLSGIEETIDKLSELRARGIGISIISLAELYEGVYYSIDPAASEKGLKDFLEEIPVLGIGEEICKLFGKERGRLRKEGKIIGDFDLMIAATCLIHDLILLSNNRKHYERVKDLRIISIQK